MAKLYGLQGAIVRLLKTDLEEQQYGTPDTFDVLIEFDAETNLVAINKLDTDWNNIEIISGVLHYMGNPVTFNPPGEGWFTRIDAEEAVTGFKNLPDYATWTPDEAEANVINTVLNGWNKTQAEDWIDANVTNLAEAKAALKIIAGALIDLRNIASKIAKMMMWLRNIVIRTR